MGIDSYHCRKCNVCMHMKYHTDHVCIENKLFCDCPICGEFMQTSTRPALFLICGHGIHEDCLDEYLKVGLGGGYHADELRVSDLHEIHHRHDNVLPVH